MATRQLRIVASRARGRVPRLPRRRPSDTVHTRRRAARQCRCRRHAHPNTPVNSLRSSRSGQARSASLAATRHPENRPDAPILPPQAADTMPLVTSSACPSRLPNHGSPAQCEYRSSAVLQPSSAPPSRPLRRRAPVSPSLRSLTAPPPQACFLPSISWWLIDSSSAERTGGEGHHGSSGADRGRS